MKHVNAVSQQLPLSAFTIDWKCIPCILLERALGTSEDDIYTICSEKKGTPCVY